MWTKKQANLLRELHSELNANQIAAEINARTGSSFTRNAIIGMSRRLGLSRTEAERRALISRALVDHYTRNPKLRGARMARRLAAVTVERDPSPKHLGIGFFDLQPHHCRFPVGDGLSATYCGHSKVDGTSYCSHHTVICYTPVQSRAERRAA